MDERREHNPSVSIIVPVYNSEATLHRCVNSILNQTFGDYELLLVDDGSLDASGRICDDYAAQDNRIRVFHKTNGGVSSARNYGLDNARGKWIAFCDSDDFVYTEWLDDFRVLENERYDLLCQGIRIENISGEIRDIGVDSKSNYSAGLISLIDKLNEQGVFGYPVTKLFKRKLIENSGCSLRFNTNYDLMEDEDFICRYLQRCRTAVYTEGIGYHYYLPSSDKHKLYSLCRVPLYKNLLGELRLVTKGEISGVERKYHDSISVILVAECQKNGFSKECMLRLRDYVLEEFRCCPIMLPTKIILALDPTGFFSALWLKLHLKIKKVDYTRS